MRAARRCRARGGGLCPNGSGQRREELDDRRRLAHHRGATRHRGWCHHAVHGGESARRQYLPRAGGRAGQATPQPRFADYGDFVDAVVTRYRGRVHYYQLWNEPNLGVEWGMQPVDAVAATELLRVGYARAKTADPGAVVIAPALAPTIAEQPD